MGTIPDIAICVTLAFALAAGSWASARFGGGYKSRELQYDENSPVPASEEERMKRVQAIVAGSVMIVWGLVVIAAATLRG